MYTPHMDRGKLQAAFERLEALRADRESASVSITSAKEYDREGLRGTSLENAPDMRQEFERHKDREPEASDRAVTGSQQVKDDRPEPSPKPPPEIARDVDRSAHHGAMRRDDAQARLDEYRAIAETLRQREQDVSRDHGLSR